MVSLQRTRSGHFSRWRERLRDPEWRRYGSLLLLGKALGLAFLFGMIFLLSSLSEACMVAALCDRPRHGGPAMAARARAPTTWRAYRR